LHSAVLDDVDFERLPEVARCHLMLIWILASRVDNVIPLDRLWIARKIAAAEPVDLELLVDRGYLEVCNGEGAPLHGAARNKALARC
jgi:hypothetical protein